MNWFQFSVKYPRDDNLDGDDDVKEIPFPGIFLFLETFNAN